MKHHCRLRTLSGLALGTVAALLLATPAYAQLTEDFHRTVPLSGNGEVSLSNVNGDVEITGWERNEVQIDAVKEARDQQRLDEAQIVVENGGDYVRIKTEYPHNRTNNNPASVHYTLHVPQNARLQHVSLVNGALTVDKVTGAVDASLVNGKAHIKDLAGPVEVSSVNGGVEADYASLSNVREIRLKSVNGSIDLGLPENPNAEFKASTVNGSIRTDFPLQVKGEFVGRRLSGTLGNGGTRIELNNVNGTIHIGPRGNM